MTKQLEPLAITGLQFFGAATAAVTHELKNALAIIKENAGLLDDYTRMSAQGMTIDNARMQTVITRIDAQTQRADTIIRNLNQFAHTVDDEYKSLDLNNTIVLLAALLQRPAAMRRVTLVARPAAEAVTILSTSPFLLLCGLGRCLNAVLPAAAAGQELILSAAKTPQGAVVRLAPLPALAQLPRALFDDNQVDPLKVLGAVYRPDVDTATLTICFGDDR